MEFGWPQDGGWVFFPFGISCPRSGAQRGCPQAANHTCQVSSLPGDSLPVLDPQEERAIAKTGNFCMSWSDRGRRGRDEGGQSMSFTEIDISLPGSLTVYASTVPMVHMFECLVSNW